MFDLSSNIEFPNPAGAYRISCGGIVVAHLGISMLRLERLPTYQLLDTPGVNAPIKHEQATAEQLARINAIMLVVREGDQDAKDVYDRLSSMIRALSRSLV